MCALRAFSALGALGALGALSALSFASSHKTWYNNDSDNQENP